MKNKLTIVQYTRPSRSNGGQGYLEARFGMQHSRIEFQVPQLIYPNSADGDDTFERDVDLAVDRARRELRHALLADLELSL